MKAIQRLIMLIVLCVASIACTLFTPAPIQVATVAPPIDTIIALTYSAALTETAAVSSAQLQPVELTSTPYQTETPASPVAYIYEGQTQSCACENCYCVTNVVIVARITIDAQGHVSGTLDKYLADIPPLNFEGTKADLHGSLHLGRDKITGTEEDTEKFSGSLSGNLSTLEGTISSTGTYIAAGKSSEQRFSAKRTFILFRK